MRIGRLWLHRREQWDLGNGGSVFPFLVAHWRSAKTSQRVFCWWRGGLRIGKWQIALPVVRAVTPGAPGRSPT